MAAKKNIPPKSVNQQKNAHFPGRPTSAKKETGDRYFGKRLLENKPRLFLYQKICVFLVAFLVFANGIPNDFNLDDSYYTTKENTLANMGIKAIPTIFTTLTLQDKSRNTFDYRPVAMLSFTLQHQFLGYAPATSHCISVIIYSFICLLIFVLLCYWLGPSKHWFAFCVALLYAVHPLHTEVVDNIKCRDELLATFFTLLSMIYIWRWQITGKAWYFVLSSFLFLIGLLSKITVVPYIAIIPLAFYFFTDMTLKKIFLIFFVFILLYYVIGSINAHVLPPPKHTFTFMENPMLVTYQPIGIKTATASYILGWYAYLHLIPYPLSFFYGYQYVQLLNWNNLQPVLSLIVYLWLIYLVIKGIRKKSIVAFGILYYLFCIILYANLFQPPPGMMAERFTFAASLGYCILLVSFLSAIADKIIPGISHIDKNRKYFAAIFLFIFISYAAMSMTRNTQWENTWVLYSHDIQHLKNSAKANMLYGEQIISKYNYYNREFNQASGTEKKIYEDSMLLFHEKEKQPFLRTLAVDPGNSKALNNLAVYYIHEDSFEKAKKYLLQARTLAPNDSDDILHYNLGFVYGSEATLNDNISLTDSAISEFKTVININPKYPHAYWRLEQLYLKKNDTVSAINNLLSGIKNMPDISYAYIELANVYLYKKDTVQAMYYNEKGANVLHPDPTIFPVLQSYYHSKNDIQKENYYRNKINMAQAETDRNN